MTDSKTVSFDDEFFLPEDSPNVWNVKIKDNVYTIPLDLSIEKIELFQNTNLNDGAKGIYAFLDAVIDDDDLRQLLQRFGIVQLVSFFKTFSKKIGEETQGSISGLTTPEEALGN